MGAAKAQLDQEELNLYYTKIMSTVDGGVLTRSVKVGETIQPGEQLLTFSKIDLV